MKKEIYFCQMCDKTTTLNSDYSLCVDHLAFKDDMENLKLYFKPIFLRCRD